MLYLTSATSAGAGVGRSGYAVLLTLCTAVLELLAAAAGAGIVAASFAEGCVRVLRGGPAHDIRRCATGSEF